MRHVLLWWVHALRLWPHSLASTAGVQGWLSHLCWAAIVLALWPLAAALMVRLRLVEALRSGRMRTELRLHGYLVTAAP